MILRLHNSTVPLISNQITIWEDLFRSRDPSYEDEVNWKIDQIFS